MFTYVVLDVWFNTDIISVTTDLDSAINMIKDSKANCIQIWSCEKLLNDFNFTKRCDWNLDEEEKYLECLSHQVNSLIEYIIKIKNMDIIFEFFDKATQCEVSTKDINIVLKNIRNNNTDLVTSFINDNKTEYCCSIDNFKKYFIEELSKELNK